MTDRDERSKPQKKSVLRRLNEILEHERQNPDPALQLLDGLQNPVFAPFGFKLVPPLLLTPAVQEGFKRAGLDPENPLHRNRLITIVLETLYGNERVLGKPSGTGRARDEHDTAYSTRLLFGRLWSDPELRRLLERKKYLDVARQLQQRFRKDYGKRSRGALSKQIRGLWLRWSMRRLELERIARMTEREFLDYQRSMTPVGTCESDRPQHEDKEEQNPSLGYLAPLLATLLKDIK